MRVALELAFFAADHEAELGVNLETGKTVHNVDTIAFHLFGPVNVLFFVETSFQFDDSCHLLAAAACLKQCLSNRRVTAAAIKRLLNCDNIRIQRGLL